VCLIVDANVAKEFLCQPGPVTAWLSGSKGSPRLVAAGKLRKELALIAPVRRVLVELERDGKLRGADPMRLQSEERRLQTTGHCQSNDRHILALAIVSGARTLATLDALLQRDFKNRTIIDKPRGKIYSDPTPTGTCSGTRLNHAALSHGGPEESLAKSKPLILFPPKTGPVAALS
jgi:predicted nucleic acid-binding protein